MSIKSVMPSNHHILCHPLFLLPSIPPSIRVFSNESTLRTRWPKYWSFIFSIIPSRVMIIYLFTCLSKKQNLLQMASERLTKECSKYRGSVLIIFLEIPGDLEIQPVLPKGNQSWIFTGKTDAEAETPILWPPDAKSWLICKDPDAGKDWRQEEKGATEDEIFGWHHWLNGHAFE